MILRNSISKAKKLLNDTLQSFKTFFSGGYQKLPKTPPFNAFSCGGGDSNMQRSFRDLDNFFEEFSGRWAADHVKTTGKTKKETRKQEPKGDNAKFAKEGEEDDPRNGSFMKFAKMNSKQGKDDKRRRKDDKRRRINDGNGEKEERESFSNSMRLEVCSVVARRLRELELMDISNVDHVLDIEEVLHYYSRITCPFYVDIVNRFFMEIYAEFLPQASPPVGSLSRSISFR